MSNFSLNAIVHAWDSESCSEAGTVALPNTDRLGKVWGPAGIWLEAGSTDR
jgi:hypothetical protein